MKNVGIAVAIVVTVILGNVLHKASYKMGTLSGQEEGCNSALALNPFSEAFGLFCEKDGAEVYIKSMAMGGAKIFNVTKGAIVTEE
jgi:hypothetical protein